MHVQKTQIQAIKTCGTPSWCRSSHLLWDEDKLVKTPNLRNSGLSVIGNIPWGMHFGLGYQTEQDIIECISSYFSFGLAANESCLWTVDRDLGLGNAEESLRGGIDEFDRHICDGRLEIKSFGFRSLNPAKVDPEMLFNALQCKALAARTIGRSGLRLCIACRPEWWLTDPPHWQPTGPYPQRNLAL